MELRTIASGSSGNCFLAGSGEGAFLIDAGISCKRICGGLALAGIRPEKLDGILITHEHSDHISGLTVFLKKYPLPVYTSPATGRALMSKVPGIEEHLRRVEAGFPFSLGGFTITPFATSHDAAGSLGFAFTDGEHRAALATDFGYVSDEVRSAILGSEYVLLEANYEDDWLMTGPYPYDLKVRIRGNRGHLSNEDSAEFACELVRAGAKTIVLGHLSKENNKPERALEVVSNRLKKCGLRDAVLLEAAPRDEPGPVWRL